jgi:FkbM family methyltransferase
MAIHYGSAVLHAKLDLADPEPAPLVEIKECRHGNFVYFPHDFYIGGSLDRYGEYVEDEGEFMLQYIKSGDIVVEVGANIGCHTVPIARKVAPDGRVFAFETQRIIFQMLCANLSINAIWNVNAMHIGLGASESLQCVYPFDYAKGNNFGGGMLIPSGGDPVQVLPLDKYALQRCDFIKIDVEGMEAEVINGANLTIWKHRPIIYMENDRPEKVKRDALIDLMLNKMDYNLYWHKPALFRVNNWRGNPQNDFGHVVSINMLCLPKEKNLPHPAGLERIVHSGELA